MSDISKITINETTYDIKDAKVRENLELLITRLGGLAYKNSANGFSTPAGTVSKPEVDITPTSKTIKVVNGNGSLPSWSANVNEETLSFNFNSGTLVPTKDETVLTGISAVECSQPIFSGDLMEITVS